ncbi:MAG: hypothetical protein K8T25_20185 [Planctomycetia bacterium]|nr:hypothetical protein [Planctomycetia bacterium]
MLCEHLQSLEQAILARGIRETYRGQPWSSNCREWVYFDCYLDTEAGSGRVALPECVVEHVHRGTHDGEERGWVCSQCHDAIIGSYERRQGMVVFPG